MPNWPPLGGPSIDVERRGLYFRAGSIGSRRNYTAPEESEWFERREVLLGGEEREGRRLLRPLAAARNAPR